MNEIKKVIISPDSKVRIYKLQPGDEFYINYKGIRYKSGDRHLEYPAIVRQVVYKPQPWYLFWKKKEIYGYFLTWQDE